VLLHPSFAEADDFLDFLHSREGGQHAAFTAHHDDSLPPLTATLNASGVFHLLPNPNVDVPGKYNFAFMGPDFHFTNADAFGADPLTSNFQHIRVCAALLFRAGYWDTLVAQVKRLFPSVVDIKTTKHGLGGRPKITVTEKSTLGDSVTLEIRSMGSAFQKVFTALVLLGLLLQPRYLGEDPYEKGDLEEVVGRYFLIEEPEAFLYPSLVSKFYELLRDVCKENGVRILVVSNSPVIIDTTVDRLLLSGEISGTVDDEKILNELGLEVQKADIDPTFAGHIIVVEGPDDIIFLKHVSPLFGFQIDDNNTRFLSVGGSGIARPELDLLLAFLKGQYSKAKVRVVRDRDFSKPNEHSHSSTAQSITWDLPTIESYVFVYFCLTTHDQGKNPFEFLCDFKTYNDFIAKYFNDLKTPQESALKPAVDSLLKKDKLSIDDFVNVAKILHGHTWVDYQAKVEGLKGSTSVCFAQLLSKYLTAENLKKFGGDHTRHHLQSTITTIFS